MTEHKEITLKKLFNIFTGKKNVNDTDTNGEFTFFSCAPETFKSKDYLYDGEAIIITGNGSYTGTVRYFNGAFDLYQRTYALTKKENVSVDVLYIYYLLKRLFEPKYLGGTRGSSIPYIVMGDIADFQLTLPPLSEQKRIANILSSFDNKIEILKKENKILEDIAENIFKEWFVKYNFPNKDGKPYKDSGGKMIDSELGPIPEGWRVGKYKDVGKLKNGINYTRNTKGDTIYRIVNTRDILKQNFVKAEELETIKIDRVQGNAYEIGQNDLLIIRSATPGKVGVLLTNTKNPVIYSGFIIRLRLYNNDYKWYIFSDLKKREEFLSNFSEGSVLKNINQELISKIRLVIPTADKIKLFSKITDILYKRIMNNNNLVAEYHKIQSSLINKLIQE